MKLRLASVVGPGTLKESRRLALEHKYLLMVSSCSYATYRTRPITTVVYLHRSSEFWLHCSAPPRRLVHGREGTTRMS